MGVLRQTGKAAIEIYHHIKTRKPALHTLFRLLNIILDDFMPKRDPLMKDKFDQGATPVETSVKAPGVGLSKGGERTLASPLFDMPMRAQIEAQTLAQSRARQAAALLGGFGPGTMFDTDEGPVPAKWLDHAHRLRTRDNGLQQIITIRRLRLSRAEAVAHPDLSPVLVARGAFGPDSPTHTVRMSPQQLICHACAYGHAPRNPKEVLIPVSSVATPLPLRRPTDAGFVYAQIVMQRHELLWVDGMWIASLFVPNRATLGCPTTDPVSGAQVQSPMQSARPVLSELEAKALLAAERAARVAFEAQNEGGS